VLVKFVSATGDPHWRGVDDAAIAPMHTHIERRAAAAESGGSGGSGGEGGERDDERESVARDLFSRQRFARVDRNGSASQTDDSNELDAPLIATGLVTGEDEESGHVRHGRRRTSPRRDADVRYEDDDDDAAIGEGTPDSVGPNGDGTMDGDDASEDEGAGAEAWSGEMQLNAGEHIDCRDRSGRWLEAVVAGVGFGRVLIHFKGWFEAPEYDEWVLFALLF
jgi:hypothetical protein